MRGGVARDFEGAVSAEGVQFAMEAGRVYTRGGRAVELGRGFDGRTPCSFLVLDAD